MSEPHDPLGVNYESKYLGRFSSEHRLETPSHLSYLLTAMPGYFPVAVFLVSWNVCHLPLPGPSRPCAILHAGAELPTLKLFREVFYQHDVMSLFALFNPFTISVSQIAFNSRWEIDADSGRLLRNLGGLATLLWGNLYKGAAGSYFFPNTYFPFSSPHSHKCSLEQRIVGTKMGRELHFALAHGRLWSRGN